MLSTLREMYSRYKSYCETCRLCSPVRGPYFHGTTCSAHAIGEIDLVPRGLTNFEVIDLDELWSNRSKQQAATGCTPHLLAIEALCDQ